MVATGGNPLALNGADDGTYSVEVKAIDNAGNVEERTFSFLYDTQVPVVSSIEASSGCRNCTRNLTLQVAPSR